MQQISFNRKLFLNVKSLDVKIKRVEKKRKKYFLVVKSMCYSISGNILI